MKSATYELKSRADMEAAPSRLVPGAVAVTVQETHEIEDGMHYLMTPSEARHFARRLNLAAAAAEMIRWHKKGTAA